MTENMSLFDNPPCRKNTDSTKWRLFNGVDVIPMWVADMDFAAAPQILAALQKRIEHGVLGYAKPYPLLMEAIIEAMQRDFDWKIKPEWLVFTPGVVPGFNLACKIAGKDGDSVLIPTPTYPPMFRAPKNNKKTMLRSEMLLKDNKWEFDWQHLESCVEPTTSVFLISNPHNPLGRIYSKDELQKIAKIAHEHDLLICSDEIHSGLLLDPNKKHIPIAMLDEATAMRSITLMAPSKTWNIAGLSSSFAIIPNAEIRERFCSAITDIVPSVNVLGLVATEAAYRHGEPWRKAVISYLRDNAKLVYDTINAIPNLSTTPVEASYLAWIDCRKLNLDDPKGFFEKHGVGLMAGQDFGTNGYVRLNFGCSRALLKQGLERIKAAAALC